MIDGQLRLMVSGTMTLERRMTLFPTRCFYPRNYCELNHGTMCVVQIPGDFIKTWSQFLQTQFVSQINRLFRLGSETVILTFDDYSHVVGAKNPTQRARVSKFKKVEWGKDQQLQAVVPPDYMTYIANRAYKFRICTMVQEHVVNLVDLSGNRRLVIDWVGPPTQYTEEGVEALPRTGFSIGLGEV
jgi:hypothetical protein